MRNSAGQAKRLIDPLPRKAATGDELLKTFFDNLARMYHSISPDQPAEAEEYITKQLERIKKVDPVSKEPCPEAEQAEWRALALAEIKRLASEIKGPRDRHLVLERWKG